MVCDRVGIDWRCRDSSKTLWILISPLPGLASLSCTWSLGRMRRPRPSQGFRCPRKQLWVWVNRGDEDQRRKWDKD